MVFAIFSVQANASAHEGLKAAFDELNYALTVEWDQQDKEFHGQQMKKFAATVRDLQAKGLTNAQMIEFVKSEVKNKQVAKDLETAFNMIQINKLSPAEANKYILDTMKKSYSSGASWSGDVFVYLGVGILIVALAVALASGNVQTTGSVCGYQNVYVCDTYCYDDWYWGYTCYDDCYYTNRYSCY
jgi:hypothetical protein